MNAKQRRKQQRIWARKNREWRRMGWGNMGPHMLVLGVKTWEILRNWKPYVPNAMRRHRESKECFISDSFP
jgi:hypothetical protein